MRLKTPKTPTTPRENVDNMVVRCYSVRSQWTIPTGKHEKKERVATYPRIQNALDQDKAPGHHQSLHRIREGMRLIRPSHVGRRNQQNSHATMSLRWDKLVKCPIFQHKADEKHEDSQCPKDGDWRDFPILTVADP